MTVQVPSPLSTLVLDPEREEAIRTLTMRERQYRLIVENTSDLITILGTDGTVQYMSPSLHPLLGYEAGALVGCNAFAFVHPDDHVIVRAAMQRALSSPVKKKLAAFRFRHHDGTWRFLESIGQANETPGGARTIVVSSRDVTDRMASEQEEARLVRELRAAQLAAESATRAKSAFLANMSHEIRTPMNALLGLTELLLDTEVTAAQRRHLEMLRDSGEALLALLNDILDLSKIESQRLVLEDIPFDLAGLLQATAALFAIAAQKGGLELVVHISPDVPQFVRGDPTRLRQILINLVGNAIKFTPAGRVIVSAVQTGHDDSVIAMRFCVRDTGIGIPTEKLEAIFGEFSQLDASTTRRYGGTGLGLVIARRLARMMGGDLSVASELNSGSEFSFTLRLPEASASAAPDNHAALPPAAICTRRLHVLLAEDNVVNQEVAAAMLRKRGHDVDVVNNGIEAVSAVNAAAPGAFDVILMDVHMPGMDGLAATAAIRTVPGWATTRIIALTADAMTGQRETYLQAGMSGYLSKPFKSRELFAIVEQRDDAAAVPSTDNAAQPVRHPPVDVVGFRSTMNEAGAGSAVDGILDGFILDAPRRSAALVAAIASGAGIDIQSAAHAYKSAAGTIGAHRLAGLLLTMEQAGREGRVDDATQLSAAVQQETDAAITYLREAGAPHHA